jgi:uncharacterized protein (DUF58 family)
MSSAVRAPVTSKSRSADGRTRALEFDWGDLRPLRIRARVAAEGLYAGMHRSVRRGPGVEFGGYRSYYPGDDLRLIDRRALLRYDKLQVREFETETERSVRVIIDASASMAYSTPAYSKSTYAKPASGSAAGGAHISGRSLSSTPSKYAYAALLAAGLAHITLRGGDSFATLVFGGATVGQEGPATPDPDNPAHLMQQLPASAARSTFERVTELYEAIIPAADLSAAPQILSTAIGMTATQARAGSLIVLFSDLLDLEEHAVFSLAELTQRRRVAVVQVLAPAELEFPFEGPVRLRAAEGDSRVDSDGAARAEYRASLAAHRVRWQRELERRGARFLATSTADAPAVVLRQLLDLLH